MSDPSQPQSPALRRLQTAWVRAALATFNFLVLFIAINLVLIPINKTLNRSTPRPASLPPPPPAASGSPVAPVAPAPPPPPPHDPDKGRPTPNAKRDPDTMDTVDMEAYKGLPDAEVEQMLDEFNDFGHLGYAYLPWVQFGPPVFKSQYCNIVADPAAKVETANTGGVSTALEAPADPTAQEFPYRKSVLDPSIKVDPSWPVLKVFVMGGSTTFGSRVSDEWTLPSALWNELQRKAAASPNPVRIELVNYGRPWYYSSQELVLLRRLIRTGRRPDVVLFVDGLNDCNNWFTMGRDIPVHTDKLTELFYLNQFGKDWLSNYGWIPIVKFAFLIRHDITPPKLPVAPISTPQEVQQRVHDILSCYGANVDDATDLCRKVGCRVYFFWQPCPFYHYDVLLHRAIPMASPPMLFVFGQVYDQVASTVPSVVDLGKSIDEYGHKKLFVDIVHYNPAFHQFLAHKMAQSIDVAPMTRK